MAFIVFIVEIKTVHEVLQNNLRLVAFDSVLNTNLILLLKLLKNAVFWRKINGGMVVFNKLTNLNKNIFKNFA